MKNKKFERKEILSEKDAATPKKLDWKRALLLIFIGIVAYAVLKAMLDSGKRYFWIIYELAAGVAIIGYIIKVRGRLGNIPKMHELPSTWTEEEKTSFLDEVTSQRKNAEPWLRTVFIFVFALMIACVTEYYIPLFTN